MIYINYKFKILFYRIIILNITILYMYNSKFGKNSMKKSSSEKANNNTALGSNSLKNNIDGYQNSAIGSSCLKLNIKGINNTGVGYKSLENALHNSNTAIGALSGLTLKSGQRNVIIGKHSDVSSENAINQIVIGEQAKGVYDNSIVLGNIDTTLIHPSTDGKVDLGSNKYRFDSIYADRLNVPSIRGDYVTIDVSTLKVKGSIMIHMGKNTISDSTTITTTQIKYGYFLISSSIGFSKIITFPNAIDLINNLPLKEDNDTFDIRIVNASSNDVSVDVGTGVTKIKSDFKIDSNNGGFLMVRRTSSTTVELVCFGKMD